MVTNDDKIGKNGKKRFHCENCCFYSNDRKDYKRHLLTEKHKKTANDDKMVTNGYKMVTDCGETSVITDDVIHTCECGKVYKHRQGLFRHKNKCKFISEETTLVNMDNDTDIKGLIMKLMTENQEIKKENSILINKITEIIPKIGNNNNNTINKNKFNINVFLNEKCKDAISMDEFIDKIEITMKNLLTTKDKGLGIGLSNIIIDNMSKLSLYERPMHCTDKKRETLYIKNDGWEKDEKKEHINDLLKKIEKEQIKSIDKWTQEHPNFQADEHLQEEYINLIRSCTSSIEDCKEKAIKKVCENIHIPD